MRARMPPNTRANRRRLDGIRCDRPSALISSFDYMSPVSRKWYVIEISKNGLKDWLKSRTIGLCMAVGLVGLAHVGGILLLFSPGRAWRHLNVRLRFCDCDSLESTDRVILVLRYVHVGIVFPISNVPLNAYEPFNCAPDVFKAS